MEVYVGQYSGHMTDFHAGTKPGSELKWVAWRGLAKSSTYNFE